MFEFSTAREPDSQTVRITISGEIDLFAAPDFKSRLYEAVGEGDVDVVLDCGALTYIDSTGLGILLGALKRVRQKDRQVYVRHLKDNIRKLFRITGLDRAFNLEDAK
jgi:anti-sigma B factor antagonist